MATHTDQSALSSPQSPPGRTPCRKDDHTDDFVESLRNNSTLQQGIHEPSAETSSGGTEESRPDPPSTGDREDAREGEYVDRIRLQVTLKLLADYLPAVTLNSLSVLQVGRGDRTELQRLRPHFRQVLACDFSPGAAPPAGQQVVVMPGPTRIPLPAQSFDVAVCTDVYHRIPPQRHVDLLTEVRRILRNGGVILVFERNPLHPSMPRNVWRWLLDPSAGLVGTSRMKHLLRAADYSDVSIRHFLSLPSHALESAAWLDNLLGLTGLGRHYCAVARAPVVESPRQPARRPSLLEALAAAPTTVALA